MKVFNPLFSQKGQSILIAIVLAAAAALTTAIMIQDSGATKIASRGPRIKSGMANLETKLRALMLQPTTYTCPDPNNIATCDVVSDAILRTLNHNVPGAQCETGNCLPQLGLVVASGTNREAFASRADWNAGTRELSVIIRFTGTDVSIRERSIIIKVPTDVLSPVITCNAAPGADPLVNPGTPLFRGFDINGAAVCTSVPPPVAPPPNISVCAPGQFISFVNTNNFSLTCTPLPDPVACPANQFINGFEWAGGANPVNITDCALRFDQMAGFAPVIQYGTAPPPYVPPAQPADFTITCTPPAGVCTAPATAKGPFVPNAGACSGASCSAGESLIGCYYEVGGFRSCCDAAPPATCNSLSAGSVNRGDVFPTLGNCLIMGGLVEGCGGPTENFYGCVDTGSNAWQGCCDAVLLPVIACNAPGVQRGGPYPNSSSCSPLDCLPAELMTACSGSAGSYQTCCSPTASGGTACSPDGTACGAPATCAADCCAGYGTAGACGP